MKYKVTEYNSDFQEEQTGTCDLCFRLLGLKMVQSRLRMKTGMKLKLN